VAIKISLSKRELYLAYKPIHKRPSGHIRSASK